MTTHTTPECPTPFQSYTRLPKYSPVKRRDFQLVTLTEIREVKEVNSRRVMTVIRMLD